MRVDWQGRARRVVAIALACLQLAVVGCLAQWPAAQDAVDAKCSNVAKDADPWLEAIAERIRRSDGLFRQLVSAHGLPSSCQGGATEQFDGQQFGSVSFGWRDGLSFTVRTLPPESSIVELKMRGGFPDKDGLFRQVQAYVQDRGLVIDWAKPRVHSTPTERTEEFASASPRINASVILTYDADTRLVSVGIRLAL